MLTRRVARVFDVLRCRGLLLGHVASLGEVQAYVQVLAVGYTQVKRFEGRAKQGKLRSVAELVESSRARQTPRQGRRRLAWCWLGTSSLTHARRRTSKSHGVDPVPLSHSSTSPRRVFRKQLFHPSLHLHFIPSLRPSILQSSFHYTSEHPCNKSLFTPR